MTSFGPRVIQDANSRLSIDYHLCGFNWFNILHIVLRLELILLYTSSYIRYRTNDADGIAHLDFTSVVMRFYMQDTLIEQMIFRIVVFLNGQLE